ncbi:MAG: FAD-binding domain-containing protein [Pseudomonadota bacterium]
MAKRNDSDAIHVVWFKRDLRIHDHRPLAAAASAGQVLPLYVIEPGLWLEPDMSARQFAFFRESLRELRDALGRLGQPLVIRVGDVTDVLDDIGQTMPVAGLWSHEETGNAWTYARDKRVGAWCREHGVPWQETRQDGVVRRLPSRNGWAGRWDRLMSEALIEAPTALAPLPPLLAAFESNRMPTARELSLRPDTCPERQRGGRDVGLQTLYTFLHTRGETYRSGMSSPLSGFETCSRLSPHLAWGTVSMREVAQATWLRQREIKHERRPSSMTWRGSLISFSGRLHWHCHFMQKLEDEPRLEYENLHRSYDQLRHPGESDAARLDAWCTGETGLPFVDACMRALRATGWMNFRMRAMLMATASYHLWLHWRAPGLHLARQFTDYEPGIHWPQTQMQSGTTGINTVRIYNPIKQGYDQDPTGAFVRRWVPELAGIEGAAVHEPWKQEAAQQILGKRYPMPIVDHLVAAREARQKIYGIRKSDGFRTAADEIQNKHGSRKSGISNTGAAKSRRASGKNSAHKSHAPAGATSQLALDLERETKT